jgi:DNA-binding XRE family transcriptional regulator
MRASQARKGKKMAKRKAERVRLEQLSRNPRLLRKSKTLGGESLTMARRALQEIREDVGISQAQLAKAAGIPRAAIANLETGRYTISARNGIDIYMALARFAPPQSPQYHEAKEEASKGIASEKEILRKQLIAAQGQIESLKKRCEEIKAAEADVASKEARLREI